MALTLLVLAAGMGSRYGGLKQLDPVGPSGETILDYAVFDARRAGFERVVFVIRRDFEAAFRSQIGAKYAGNVAVDYVFQGADILPENYQPSAQRQKPWGTGHAVWCAREAVRGNFAVINADDFYGADSFQQLARFLVRAHGTDAAMVGFKLANTLSEHGTVSRGLCTTDAEGKLSSIVEQTGIAAADVGREAKYSGDEIVSMNCWGFTPALFGALEAQLRNFLDLALQNPASSAEFYLPTAVSALIARGEAHVAVLTTTSAWFGVTYREDKSRVQAALRRLVDAGVYPVRLF